MHLTKLITNGMVEYYDDCLLEQSVLLTYIN